MASMQCYKPAEKTCDQGHHQSSLGQKTGCAMAQERQTQYTDPGMAQTQVCYSLTQTQCQTKPMTHTQTPSHGQNVIGMTKTQSHCMGQTDASNAMTCEGKTKRRGEHKERGLFQKIKDGISGDSSCSSSDSESDDEKCCNRKN